MSVNSLDANRYYLLFQNSQLVPQASGFSLLYTDGACKQALMTERASSLGELLLIARTFLSPFYMVKIAFLHCLFNFIILTLHY